MSDVQDSQAIAGWTGPGPYDIINNHVEATGEDVGFGGAVPAIMEQFPRISGFFGITSTSLSPGVEDGSSRTTWNLVRSPGFFRW